MGGSSEPGALRHDGEKAVGNQGPEHQGRRRGRGQHPVRDEARAAARPATGRLFRGGGCEVAGVKPIKIYHYAKDAVNPLP